MMQHTVRDAEGTLMYVTATGSLFLKVSQGWKEIQVLTWASLKNTFNTFKPLTGEVIDIDHLVTMQ